MASLGHLWLGGRGGAVAFRTAGMGRSRSGEAAAWFVGAVVEMSWLGPVSFGEVRRVGVGKAVAVTVGMAALGSPRLGGRVSVWRGPQWMRGAGCGMSGSGLAVVGRPRDGSGTDRLGVSRRGRAVTVAHGLALFGWVCLGGYGGRGTVGADSRGGAWHVSVGRSWFGSARVGASGLARAWTAVTVWPGRHWSGWAGRVTAGGRGLQRMARRVLAGRAGAVMVGIAMSGRSRSG